MSCAPAASYRRERTTELGASVLVCSPAAVARAKIEILLGRLEQVLLIFRLDSADSSSSSLFRFHNSLRRVFSGTAPKFTVPTARAGSPVVIAELWMQSDENCSSGSTLTPDR